jgi:hypothetical protein
VRIALPTRGLSSQTVLDYAAHVAAAGTGGYFDQCQRFVGDAFGAHSAPTALAAWQGAQHTHPGDTNPPAGVALYWDGKAGHAAISAGTVNGVPMAYSTDVLRHGQVDLVPISQINDWLGSAHHYLGWSADTNGATVTKFNASPIDGRGSGVPGTTAGGGVATTLDPKMLAGDFGYAAGFYNTDPSLKKLIAQATKGQWTPEMFGARLMGTKWYRTHDAAQRKWIQLTTSDPAEAQQQQKDRATQVTQLSTQLGVPIPAKRAAALVADSLKFGWTDAQISDGLAAEFKYTPGQAYGGVVGQTLDSLRAAAKSYVVPLSDATLQKWTTQVAQGDATPDTFNDYLKTQAKSLFPELSGAIDSGVTPDQYFDPYRQQAAQTLGVTPDSVDFSDPKWQSILFNVDPKTGARGVQSLAQAATTLRTGPQFGFDKTSGAVDQAAQFATSISQMFGGSG